MTIDPNQPAILVSVPTEVEAAAIVTLLSSFGVDALTTGGFTAGLRAEAPGLVQVVVRQKDLAEGRRILESSAKRTTIDWSQVDIGDEQET